MSESGLTWRLDHAGSYADVEPGVRVPIVVSGVVDADGAAVPPEVLLAVNGRVAGVAVPRADGGDWRFRAVVDERLFVAGSNRIDLYIPGAQADGLALSRIERVP